MSYSSMWILSPIVLIPAVVFLLYKKDKMESFLKMLLRDGRITKEEYNNLFIHPNSKSDGAKSGTGCVPPYVNMQSDEKQAFQANSFNTGNAKQTNAYQSFVKQPDKNFTGQTVYNNSVPVYNPISVKQTNPANTMLIIGVIFVILAGVVFSTAVWLYIGYLGRTAIIALSSLFFFAMGLFAQKKLKLLNTGMAFYMLGSVFCAITFITAGYFKLMGDWLSVSGGGSQALFALSALIISAFSFGGTYIYKKKIFVSASLYSAQAALTFICIQIFDSYTWTVFFLNTAAAAVFFAVKKASGLKEIFEKPVRDFALVCLVFYILASVPPLLTGFVGDWNLPCYLMAFLYLIQTTYYGIKRNNRFLIAFQCLIVIGLSFEASVQLTNYDDSGFLLLGILSFTIFFGYRFCSRLRTCFSDFAFPLVIAVCGFLMSGSGRTEYLKYAAVLFSLLSVIIVFLSVEKDRETLIIIRILAPVPIIFTVWGWCRLAEQVYNSDYRCLAGIIGVIIMVIFNSVFSWLSKYGKRFETLRYSFCTAAGLILIYTAAGLAETITAYIIIIALAVLLFAVCMTAKNNFASFMPAAAFLIASAGIGLTRFSSEPQAACDMKLIMLSIAFLLLGITSRLLFEDKVISKSYDSLKIDSPGIIMAIVPFILISGRNGGNLASAVWTFIAFIEMALFSLNLCRKQNEGNQNRGCITAAAAFVCLAIKNRPFFIIDEGMIAHKVNILLILMFGVFGRLIWKKDKKVSENFTFVTGVIAVAGLVLDALIYKNLLNNLFILCALLVLMLWSFAAKRKRWFKISSITLAGLTLYFMKDFLLEIDWWVYLLLVGILLISIAALNEYFRSRGDNIKEKAGRFFQDWNP